MAFLECRRRFRYRAVRVRGESVSNRAGDQTVDLGEGFARCGRCLPCRRREVLRAWERRWVAHPVVPVAFCTLLFAGVYNWFVVVLGDLL